MKGYTCFVGGEKLFLEIPGNSWKPHPRPAEKKIPKIPGNSLLWVLAPFPSPCPGFDDRLGAPPPKGRGGRVRGPPTTSTCMTALSSNPALASLPCWSLRKPQLLPAGDQGEARAARHSKVQAEVPQGGRLLPGGSGQLPDVGQGGGQRGVHAPHVLRQSEANGDKRETTAPFLCCRTTQ